MLGQVPQYRSTIRNYVIAFGSIFDDITVDRKKPDGTIDTTIKVPLAYGPSQKYIARIEAPGGNIYGNTQITLPRMSFEITGMTYDSARKRNKIRGIRTEQHDDTTKKADFIYNPVPYDISFELSIMVKNAEDGTQILEQILPFFTPSFTIPIRELDQFNVVNDTPLILDSVNIQDDYEGDFTQRRALIWTLGFTLKGNIYGNASTKGVITKATTNIYEYNPSTGEVYQDALWSEQITENDFGFGENV